MSHFVIISHVALKPKHRIFPFVARLTFSPSDTFLLAEDLFEVTYSMREV